jgi:tRNA 2-thiouridine synthesizing protein D
METDEDVFEERQQGARVATMTVILGEPPYGRERAYLAMRFVMTARTEGHDVNLFLFEEAVHLPIEDERDPAADETEEGLANSKNLIRSAIEMGADVRICGICAKQRQLQPEDLVEGARIGSMQDLVRWVAESDRVVTF